MAKNVFFFKPLRPSTTKISVSLWTLVLNKKKNKKKTLNATTPLWSNLKKEIPIRLS